MPGSHSAIVGGSSAGRILGCPASYQTTLALPPSVDVTSEFAEEGTHLHHVSDALMRARQQDNDADLYTLASSFVGQHFYDRDFSSERLADAIEPALDALNRLEQEYGGGFKVLSVEKRVRFPGIPGAFGTADLLLGSASHLLLADWKHGSGVPVSATYPTADGQGEYVNPQILFYFTASRHSSRHLFTGNKILVGAIIQPRADPEHPYTHTIIGRKELTYFAQDLERAVVEALSRDPRRTKGEWCRWAPCKVNCPHWTGPLLDLTAMGVKPKTQVEHPNDNAYGEYLARCKALLDMALVLKPTVDEQIHSALDAGIKVPGWRLKAKQKNRQWLDETIVVPVLKELGFADNEIWQKKLATFTAADAAAKRRGVEIPAHLRVAPPTNETVVAADSDPAPVVERHVAVAAFSEALKKLQQA